MRQLSLVLRLLAFGCVFAPCLPAGAEPNDAASAEELFAAGRASLEAGDDAAACDHFRASDALEHGLGTWLNLGLCEERLGHLVSAAQYYRRVVEAAPESDARAAIARERVLTLEERIPRVTLRLAANAPPDTVVAAGAIVYDGAARARAIPHDPGVQRFTVTAPGFAARDYEVTLAEGERIELVLAPGAPLTVPAPSRSSHAASPADHGPERAGASESSRVLGWGLVAAGGAALAVGAVTGGMLLHDQSVVNGDCDASKACGSSRAVDAAGQGRRLNVVSPVALLSGVLLTGAGAFVLLESSREHSATRIGALVAPGAAKLEVLGAF